VLLPLFACVLARLQATVAALPDAACGWRLLMEAAEPGRQSTGAGESAGARGQAPVGGQGAEGQASQEEARGPRGNSRGPCRGCAGGQGEWGQRLSGATRLLLALAGTAAGDQRKKVVLSRAIRQDVQASSERSPPPCPLPAGAHIPAPGPARPHRQEDARPHPHH